MPPFLFCREREYHFSISQNTFSNSLRISFSELSSYSLIVPPGSPRPNLTSPLTLCLLFFNLLLHYNCAVNMFLPVGPSTKVWLLSTGGTLKNNYQCSRSRPWSVSILVIFSWFYFFFFLFNTYVIHLRVWL